jgi:spermidine/putrescine transport system permease protein
VTRSVATTSRRRIGGRPGPGATALRLLSSWAVPAFTVFAIAFILLPILVMIVFSFNDPPGRFNFVWGNFSLAAWANPFARLGLEAALQTSLLVATISTIVSTALGTLIGLALTRYEFRGRSAANLFIFIPMATPEIVLGASLLTLFVGTANEPWHTLTGGTLFPLGVGTILVAHIMFNISYVVVTVRARMQGFPRHLEEAAMDLGANEWTTFWKVTFPLIFPGILAAALLAFSLSIDDFIITNFTSGTANTFPVWVWASIRNNLPPQIHVIGTAVFLAAVGLVVISTVFQARGARRPPPRVGPAT